MQTLLEFLELDDMVQLEKTANLLEFDLSSILSRAHNRINPVKNFPQKPEEEWGREGGVQHKVPNDIAAKMEEALKRLQAARTGLGLANKLKDYTERRAHKSRILKNLNLLRLIIQHVEEELAKGEKKPDNTPVAQREPVGNENNAEPYMGGTEGFKESVNPELVKAVKDFKHAQKEVEKIPFKKSKVGDAVTKTVDKTVGKVKAKVKAYVKDRANKPAFIR